MRWEDVGFVKASKIRRAVMKELRKRPLSPKELTESLEMHFPQVSEALRELEERGLAICLTGDRRKGKIFRLTSEGVEVFNEIEP